MKKNIILIEKSNMVFQLLREKLKTCFKNKIKVLRYNNSSQYIESKNSNCDLYIYDYENSSEDFKKFLKYLKDNNKKSTLIFSNILDNEKNINLSEYDDEYIKFSKYNELNEKIQEELKIN